MRQITGGADDHRHTTVSIGRSAAVFAGSENITGLMHNPFYVESLMHSHAVRAAPPALRAASLPFPSKAV
jgi:hypothetical protein